MAGEFLRKKWEAHFDGNDVNKDGVITKADAQLFAFLKTGKVSATLDRFIQHYNLKGEKAREIEAGTWFVWNNLFLFGREVVDRPTYLELTEKDYRNNRTEFVERHRRAVRRATEIFDVNKDGCLSEEEFLVFLECSGTKGMTRKFVQSIPQVKPGYVSNDAFVEMWVAFHSNGDVNNAERERPIMVTMGMIDEM